MNFITVHDQHGKVCIPHFIYFVSIHQFGARIKPLPFISSYILQHLQAKRNLSGLTGIYIHYGYQI